MKTPLVSIRKESFSNVPEENQKEVLNTSTSKEMDILRFETQEMKYKTNETETLAHLFEINHPKTALEDYREIKPPSVLQCY